jgi:hypothetical protein
MCEQEQQLCQIWLKIIFDNDETIMVFDREDKISTCAEPSSVYSDYSDIVCLFIGRGARVRVRQLCAAIIDMDCGFSGRHLALPYAREKVSDKCLCLAFNSPPSLELLVLPVDVRLRKAQDYIYSIYCLSISNKNPHWHVQRPQLTQMSDSVLFAFHYIGVFSLLIDSCRILLFPLTWT